MRIKSQNIIETEIYYIKITVLNIQKIHELETKYTKYCSLIHELTKPYIPSSWHHLSNSDGLLIMRCCGGAVD